VIHRRVGPLTCSKIKNILLPSFEITLKSSKVVEVGPAKKLDAEADECDKLWLLCDGLKRLRLLFEGGWR